MSETTESPAAALGAETTEVAPTSDYSEPMSPQEIKNHQTKALGISTQMTPMMAVTQLAHGAMLNEDETAWISDEAKQVALKHFQDASKMGSVTPWAREPAIRLYFQKHLKVDLANPNEVKELIKTKYPHLS